jgi:hypothetical protein
MSQPILRVTVTERAAFIVAFVIVALMLMHQRHTRPDNVKPERKPDADFETFDKRTPILPKASGQ